MGLEQAAPPRSLRITGPARSAGDSPALTEDFYRRVAEIGGRPCRPLESAQVKYEAVRDAMRALRPRAFRRPTDQEALAEYIELSGEFDDLFNLVSSNFPDPARQRAEDLGLEG